MRARKVTHVRGLKERTERKNVITHEEVKEMLYEAKQIPEKFYRLRRVREKYSNPACLSMTISTWIRAPL
jgi:hypothetical protein